MTPLLSRLCLLLSLSVGTARGILAMAGVSQGRRLQLMSIPIHHHPEPSSFSSPVASLVEREACPSCGHPFEPWNRTSQHPAPVRETPAEREIDKETSRDAAAADEEEITSCTRPHKKPPFVVPNRLPLYSPGSGVYGDPDERGNWFLMTNAPYGRHSRPKNDVFGGLGWGYGYGCVLGQFFGTGVGATMFPPTALVGAGAGFGLVCGIGQGCGICLGMGNGWIALGFNEPLTQTPRFYRIESEIERFILKSLDKYLDWREKLLVSVERKGGWRSWFTSRVQHSVRNFRGAERSHTASE